MGAKDRIALKQRGQTRVVFSLPSLQEPEYVSHLARKHLPASKSRLHRTLASLRILRRIKHRLGNLFSIRSGMVTVRELRKNSFSVRRWPKKGNASLAGKLARPRKGFRIYCPLRVSN